MARDLCHDCIGCRLALGNRLRITSNLETVRFQNQQKHLLSSFVNHDGKRCFGRCLYDLHSGAPASGVTITGDDVDFSGGVLNDRIDQGSNPDTLFSFDAPILGFGGDWDLAGPGGQGTGISITTMNGGSFVVTQEVPRTLENDFWGFISDMEFSSLSFFEGSQASGVETYTLDNLTTGGVSPVPLPAGLPLLLVGLGGLAALRRKKS